MTFLIAYDIADPARLRRVARHMERKAVRCQKSVFLFRGNRDQVAELLHGVGPLLNADEDVVQAWLLNPHQPDNLVLGTPLPVRPGGVVLGENVRLFVERQNEIPSEEESE